MKPYYQDAHRTLYNHDCRSMFELPDESVQCVVTSPPYWGLRKYAGQQDLIWGGNPGCEHKWNPTPSRRNRKTTDAGNNPQGQDAAAFDAQYSNTCALCGAWYGGFGLEPNPELYVQHTIEILREIRRVLRRDGVVFWNIGDCYASGKGTCHNPGGGRGSFNTIDGLKSAGAYPLNRENISELKKSKLKPKDLCLIPFRVAIAAQEPYQEFTIKELADRAWLAGIIDGEGCISIHHYERQDGDNHYHQFQPFISVGSIDLPLIERIVRITRMNGTRQTTEPRDIDRRGIISRHANYEWRVEGDNAIKVIEDVFPNLTIKRKQACIAYELARCYTPHTGRGSKVPPDITTHKLKLWQMIKDCNQRKEIDVDLSEPSPHIEPGWWVRSDIIWSKNNPMPESVTDRPTNSHEYILMLTKSSRYYWDAEAVREITGKEADWETYNKHLGKTQFKHDGKEDLEHGKVGSRTGFPNLTNPNGHNLRSVWTFPTQPYKGAHFATFPEALPERCIKAATPEAGYCPECGAPWVRVFEKTGHVNKREPAHVPCNCDTKTDSTGWQPLNRETDKWTPSCQCQTDKPPVSSLVLDPFAGSGTTLFVAARLGRSAVGYEISEEYCRLIINRNKQHVLV